ncbi:aldehyde dehydrogenase family protein [Rhodococcoides yunnanense]|uniref:aldehyde dehydrogenase family protein n=1 Tax=Rhodococcoides yunnanense TaxID=278209 RepID=UPI0009335CB1|nr:aldehyde dehydrogenase family protein [Rhodococcus yunnanensis]
MSIDSAKAQQERISPTQHAQAVREAFSAGVTRPLEWRREQLHALDRLLAENGPAIEQAVHADLGKPLLEAFLTEIRSVRTEIAETIKHLSRWTRPRSVKVPFALKPGSGQIVREPLGTVLVIAPWNYPVHLLFMPVVAAIAAGNAVVMKPSEVAPATAALAEELVPKYLDNRAIRVVTGAVEETTELLELPWDHIFYTGNGAVGRIVMAAASKHLTPVTLELGGKSPVWVDSSADVDATAHWLAWGKFLNAGQTCVAPDYVLTTADVAPRLVEALRREIEALYGADPKVSRDFGRVVNTRHLDRLTALLPQSGTAAIGGQFDRDDRYLAPTVLADASLSDPVMQDEIFGPILPIITVSGHDEAIRIINDRDKPLALYIFAKSRDVQEAFVERTSSGGVGINAPMLQLGVSSLPFGGVGGSGMGAYHGEHGIRTFSHERAVLVKKGRSRLMVLGQPPFTARKERLLRGRAPKKDGSNS